MSSCIWDINGFIKCFVFQTLSSNNPGKLSMNVRNNVPKTDAMIVINTIPENNANTNDDIGTYQITMTRLLWLCI